MNLNDVINYILSTENLEDIPNIMDAITERVATEMGIVAENTEEMVEEMPVEEVPAEAPVEGGLDLSQLSL